MNRPEHLINLTSYGYATFRESLYREPFNIDALFNLSPDEIKAWLTTTALLTGFRDDFRKPEIKSHKILAGEAMDFLIEKFNKELE